MACKSQNKESSIGSLDVNLGLSVVLSKSYELVPQLSLACRFVSYLLAILIRKGIDPINDQLTFSQFDLFTVPQSLFSIM